jgi:hypothetical protein
MGYVPVVLLRSTVTEAHARNALDLHPCLGQTVIEVEKNRKHYKTSN